MVRFACPASTDSRSAAWTAGVKRSVEATASRAEESQRAISNQNRLQSPGNGRIVSADNREGVKERERKKSYKTRRDGRHHGTGTELNIGKCDLMLTRGTKGCKLSLGMQRPRRAFSSCSRTNTMLSRLPRTDETLIDRNYTLPAGDSLPVALMPRRVWIGRFLRNATFPRSRPLLPHHPPPATPRARLVWTLQPLVSAFAASGWPNFFFQAPTSIKGRFGPEPWVLISNG